MTPRKHFTPLESNPDIFNELVRILGLRPTLSFHDVLSLDDPDLLAFVPRPVLALSLVFSTPSNYEEVLAELDKDAPGYARDCDDEDVIWYKQTINNACGLYAILHAVSNGPARDHIEPKSHLARLLAACVPLQPDDRAAVLEQDEQLAATYKAVALKGDSEAPANPEDEVDFHYVCFVKSRKNGHLYELDGDRKGPIDRGPLDNDEYLLSESGRCLKIVNEFIKIRGLSGSAGLLALASSE
ncbi:putative ubiquitin carboxyl-terminal hydrolase [Podospora conica]|nr:putative ubiquitin carboxyl-terminal hydrolase [Schizothecium conicum]